MYSKYILHAKTIDRHEIYSTTIIKNILSTIFNISWFSFSTYLDFAMPLDIKADIKSIFNFLLDLNKYKCDTEVIIKKNLNISQYFCI